MDPLLNGLHVAILATNGFEQVELTEPKQALEREGAITKLISDQRGTIQGLHHTVPADQFAVDLTFDEADPQDFDAFLLPGGETNAGRLRHIEAAQQLMQGATAANKPVAVICHGAWLLVSAGLVDGKTMTSWPGLKDEIERAGGNWVDQEVVVDGNWVSSRMPDDLPAFNARMIEVLSSDLQAHMRGTGDEHAVGIASS